jgi:hypothetical protein
VSESGGVGVRTSCACRGQLRCQACGHENNTKKKKETKNSPKLMMLGHHRRGGGRRVHVRENGSMGREQAEGVGWHLPSKKQISTKKIKINVEKKPRLTIHMRHPRGGAPGASRWVGGHCEMARRKRGGHAQVSESGGVGVRVGACRGQLRLTAGTGTSASHQRAQGDMVCGMRQREEGQGGTRGSERWA